MSVIMNINRSKKMYKRGLSQRTTPVSLKKQLFLVKNYRPVSVLPTVKIFEKIMQKQIIDYINQYLLP